MTKLRTQLLLDGVEPPLDPKFKPKGVHYGTEGLGNMQDVIVPVAPVANPSGLGELDKNFKFKNKLEETPGLGEPSGIPFPSNMVLPEGLGETRLNKLNDITLSEQKA